MEMHGAWLPALADLRVGERLAFGTSWMDSAVHMLGRWLGGRSSSRNEEALYSMF